MTAQHQHNVLIVDDHRITQSGLRFLFSSLDRFVIVDALDCGAMVNAFVQSQPVDLVILDLNLLDVRGINVLAEIVGSGDMTVIILTGETNLAEIHSALKLGARAVMSKSDPLDHIVAACDAAITPFARLAHVDTGSDAFAETGGNAALTVAKGDQKTTFVSLGGRAQFNADQPGFQPYVSAAWNLALNDRSAPVVSRFTSGGPEFGILGTAIPKNAAELEAGFEYTAGSLRLGAAYTGTLASDRSSHGARVTARIAF